MIVELKAEYPKLSNNEIANIVHVRTGRRLGKHTAGRSQRGAAVGPGRNLAGVDLPRRAIKRSRYAA